MLAQMSDAGQALIDDVLGIKAGMPAKIWSPEQLFVIAVRKQLQKSQPNFAKLLGIPVGTLRDWEQGSKGAREQGSKGAREQAARQCGGKAN